MGTLIGGVAAVAGGRLDRCCMRTIDALSALPHLLVGIFIVAMLRPGLGAVVASVALTHWTSTARIVRAELLSLRSHTFIDAAISGGSSRRRILRRHFLPHVAPQILLATTLLVPHAIWHETALSFLGLGLPPHLASLGNMISDGRASLLAGGWWAGLAPGAVLVALALAIAAITSHWRQVLNPRTRDELQL
jgi:peptide/nickel transport system permease protein